MSTAHSTLTGSDLHEPKGIASAVSGTVYVADGLGSGAWSSISTVFNFTGIICDFLTPIAPSGWLELDGSAISRTTYASLFGVVTIQQTGTRTNGSAIITGLSSTTDMKVGYYIGGTGITNGTTVLTVDSATQVTMSANATSSGSNTCILSPWALGNGTTTFTLPDFTTSGRYRRSRTSSVPMGTIQASANLTHTHTGTTNTDGGGGATGGQSNAHNHGIQNLGTTGGFTLGGGGSAYVASGSTTTDNNVIDHSHTIPNHAHAFTTASSGGSEGRPVTVVVMSCVKY